MCTQTVFINLWSLNCKLVVYKTSIHYHIFMLNFRVNIINLTYRDRLVFITNLVMMDPSLHVELFILNFHVKLLMLNSSIELTRFSCRFSIMFIMLNFFMLKFYEEFPKFSYARFRPKSIWALSFGWRWLFSLYWTFMVN